MPTARDALKMMIEAKQRLQELGWWEGGGLRVKRGEDCAVAQVGSTGMWMGYVEDNGEYVHFCDSITAPRNAFLKPLADLTSDERQWMLGCDQREAEANSARFERMNASDEAGDA